MRIGDTVHRLRIKRFLGPVGPKSKRMVEVECECGTIKLVEQYALARGHAKSCGCFRRDRMATLTLTHGHTRRAARSYLYTLWMAVRERVFKHPYAQRGIAVDPTWAASFESFRDYVREHLGPRPRGMSLDRIDNDGDYVPGNVHWATPKQQARNRSDNTVITVDGISRCVAEWAEINGLTSIVICARLRRGWAPARAVTEPRRRWTPRLEVDT